MLVTVSFPTIIYQLRSEKDHQKADGPGVRSPAPPPRKRPAHSVRGVPISLVRSHSVHAVNHWIRNGAVVDHLHGTL